MLIVRKCILMKCNFFLSKYDNEHFHKTTASIVFKTFQFPFNIQQYIGTKFNV